MRLRHALLLGLCCGATTSAPQAHHSVLGFDGSRGLELSGVVREVAWTNPHTIIVVEGDGAGRWTIESEGPGVLVRLGWTRAAMAIGDRVRVVGAPARDGTRRLRCNFVQTPSGSRLPCFPAASL